LINLIGGLWSAEEESRDTYIVGNSPLEEKAQWWGRIFFGSLGVLLLAGWAWFSYCAR
jgi:hypothetical protein